AAFKERGLLDIRPTREEARAALIGKWAADPLPAKDKLILANYNRDIRSLNVAAQEEQKRRGLLGKRSIRVGDYELHGGDRVVFRKNHASSRMEVRHGEFGQVLGVGNRILPLVSVRMDDGRKVLVPLPDYPHLSLGFAGNAWTCQGAGVETSYTL